MTLKKKFIFVALFLGIFFWVFDSFVDSFILGGGGFTKEIVVPEPHEVWMRLFVFLLLTAFAYLSAVMVEKKRFVEEELRLIVDEQINVSGVGFFQALVSQLSDHFKTSYAFVGEFVDDTSHVETIAVRVNGDIGDKMRYALKGTPCEELIAEPECFHSEGVAALFPDDSLLRELAIESYRGIVLHDMEGRPAGLMAVMDDKPMIKEPSSESMLKVLSARAATELMLWRAQKEKRELLEDLRGALDGGAQR